MIIAVPKETHPGERRVALIPAHAKKLVELGAQVRVEKGLASSCGIADQEYAQAGAEIIGERDSLLRQAHLVLRLRPPSREEASLLSPGSILIGFLDPFRQTDLIQQLARQGVTAFSMELIPRTTRAQKMDALSSQANLAGYVAVILAAHTLDKIFPMMTTPAGTIAPARVFVIGAGVAGLQAIATAKRLGARVEAYDTRPAVEEQVRSLGARFVKIDLGETGETKEGYARALTPEQLERQREAMTRYCASADVVITTAQVFGRRAPILVTDAMLRAMKRGSVVVDLAVESGGNVEGVVADKIVETHGVRIIGFANLPGLVPLDASQMYSSNLTNFVSEFWDREKKQFDAEKEDEILTSSLVTYREKIRNQRLLDLLQNREE